MEKPNPTEGERQAALDRLMKARAEVSAKMPLMSGRPQTPEERQAYQAATQELAAASKEADRLGVALPDADYESIKADLTRRIGKKD